MSEGKKFLLVDDFKFKGDDVTGISSSPLFRTISGVLNVTICGETHEYHTQGYTYCDYDKFVEATSKRDERIAELESELKNLRESLSTSPRKISDIKDKDELKKECIGRFRKMWTYISELSAEEHRCVDKKEALKTLYPHDFNDLREHSYCYLCYCADDCESCPVKWNSCRESCGGDSCYSKWVDAKSIGDYSKASKYAAKIATLPLKEKKKGLILKDPTKDKFYGNVGEETLMKDMYGDVLHVGDVVKLRSSGYKTTQIVVHPDGNYPFIMGICGACGEDGSIHRDWSVKMVTSCKELKLGDKVCNFAVEETQFIRSEDIEID